MGSPDSKRYLCRILELNLLIGSIMHDIFKNEQCEMSSTNKVASTGTDPDASKKGKRKESSIEDCLPNGANPKWQTEILSVLPEVRAELAATIDSLDTFESYIRQPSEETAEKLKLLYDSGKGKNFVTPEKKEKIFSCLECDECEDSDQEIMHNSKTGYQKTSFPSDSNSIDEESLSSAISVEASQKDSLEGKRKNLTSPQPPKKSLNSKSYLKNEIKSLKEEKEAILGELGEMKFSLQRKEREERSSRIYHQIFPSSSHDLKDERFLVCRDASKEKYHQPGEESMATRAKSETGFQGGNRFSALQNVLSINPKKKATGGEGIKTNSEEEKINTDRATILKDEENLSIQQNIAMQITSNSMPHKDKENEIGNVESGAKRSVDQQTSISRNETDDQTGFSVQQDDANGKEFISLASKPPISVATTLYNNYKRLLLTLAQSLLFSEVVELKNWAKEKFSIENAQNASDVLFQLDEKGAINAEDLNQLCGFFKLIIRYDLVHIIEAFLLGDYSLFRLIPSKKKASRVRNSQLGGISWNDHASASSSRRSSVSSTASGETVRNPARLGKPQNNNEPPSSGPRQIQEAASSSFSVLPNPSNPGKLFSRTPNENQSTARVQQDLTPTATGLPTPNINKMVVPNGSTVSEERRTMAANVSTRTSRVTKNTLFTSSNGLKHSKFQRPSIVSNSRAPSNSGNLEVFNVQDDNWLCSHYKRHCFVKFECCDKFWPCHRCHNNQSACGRKKLKSRDTKMLKCVYCNKEQQFGQFCCDCGAKFSNYFCGLCKHLTGHDDFPYHCEKCGICRIHGDRSFHCDVCGVCLDVQLQGNHKCREGSAHDECCICLEDAFTGCQILPCSHKVHKECATQMIRSGITRCPICRESFAHKLERRPTTTSKKHSGK